MKNKWISVEDRLPDSVNEDVWVYGEEGVTIGTCWRLKIWEEDRAVWSDLYGIDDGMRDDTIYGVTHWMKMDIPEPPKEPLTGGEEE